MNKQQFTLAGLTLLSPALLLGCTNQSATNEETQTGEGNLVLVANGEDFVRQGFVTKDGWQISFDHLYVTLANVTAYQSDPPFDPDKDSDIQAQQQVTLVDAPQTVDLAAGPEDADPIEVIETQAPAGTYNALSWQLVNASTGEVQGHSIVIDGVAEKDGRTIDFTINVDKQLAYTCGEYVGDQRKGFLNGGERGELETTFHFDHIFGDGEAPADDPINTGALGFEPLAALATGDTLEVDLATLESELSSEDYQTLENAIAGLGHVGEGHCQETELET